MRAFVTGGGGFIGSHLVDLLAGEGHEVTALLAPGESTRNLSAEGVQVVRGDITNRAEIDAAMPETDIVYHLAARTDLRGRALADYAANTDGTANVLAAAKAHGASRFVLFSTMLAVAVTGKAEPIDETFTGDSQTAYGRSKRQAERIVAESDLPWTVIRPTLVYGPRERWTMREFLRAIKGRRFMLIGRDYSQSFVYVKNLVAATYAASLHPAAAGHVFFINDERPYTLAEFARASAEALGTQLRRAHLPRIVAMGIALAMLAAHKLTGLSVPLLPSRVRTMTTHYVYSINKAKDVFGYVPPYRLAEALAETAGWYQAHDEL